MTLLIDADYLIYHSCCACEQDTRWNEWEHTLHTDERDIMNLIAARPPSTPLFRISSSICSRCRFLPGASTR